MKNQEDKPASFIGKLYNILRSKQYAKIIYWDSQNKGIRILNQKKLEETILPKYFRHNRISSFVRQLNMYDFHKVHIGDHRSIFLHHEFDPKKKQNIHLIRRKITFEIKGESQSQKERENNIDQRTNKQNVSIFDLKSSKKVIYKNSMKMLISENITNLNNSNEDEIIMEQLISELNQYKQNKKEFQERLKWLKNNNKRYRKYLKKKSFLRSLHQRLEIQHQEQENSLSELSIEDQLVFKTKKSIPLRSLRLLESGPINYKKETIRNFFNW